MKINYFDPEVVRRKCDRRNRLIEAKEFFSCITAVGGFAVGGE